jgi:hypothetical protein
VAIVLTSLSLGYFESKIYRCGPLQRSFDFSGLLIFWRNSYAKQDWHSAFSKTLSRQAFDETPRFAACVTPVRIEAPSRYVDSESIRRHPSHSMIHKRRLS